LSQSDFHEPVNIATRLNFTILDFAKLIIKLTGSKSTITLRNHSPRTTPNSAAPTSPAPRNYRLEPKVDLETGLRHAIEYFRDKV